MLNCAGPDCGGWDSVGLDCAGPVCTCSPYSLRICLGFGTVWAHELEKNMSDMEEKCSRNIQNSHDKAVLTISVSDFYPSPKQCY
jgi:hypothetical protein